MSREAGVGNGGGTEQEASKRLELSLNPEDGSLLTAPLLSVVLGATDALYNDLQQMATGEVTVTTLQSSANPEDAEDEAANKATKPESSLASLSFAQRRHELSYRLNQHHKAATHVAAVHAAAALLETGKITQVSTRALQHARTAWVQADEAQDALYFFHAQLFHARKSPHDVYGALDVLLDGRWYDMPANIQLMVDRYQASDESQWKTAKVQQEWHLAVQDKLLRGEVGTGRLHELNRKGKASLEDSFMPWKISVHGGVVTLTHGLGRSKSLLPSEPDNGKIQDSSISENDLLFPLEAKATVFSTQEHDVAQWTLLSVNVHVSCKTGESNHQLELSNRQRYDLHRLCVQAMAREEHRAHKMRESKKSDQLLPMEDVDDFPKTVARPLFVLFQMAYTFQLSWQLEVLSAQALALKKAGLWDDGNVSVVPVQFRRANNSILGSFSIWFWSVDCRYGSPTMADLSVDEAGQSEKHDATGSVQSSTQASRTAGRLGATEQNQYCLEVRAQLDSGIEVSMSGGSAILQWTHEHSQAQEHIKELLDSFQNPFSLSTSQALLAATRLCAELKCVAVVKALNDCVVNGAPLLPEWMSICSVDGGSIAIAAKLRYHGIAQPMDARPVVLFRMACDSRTGQFVPTFCRSTRMLRSLASNDPSASEATALRVAVWQQQKRNQTRRKLTTAGRAVREAFEALSRSLHALGQRTGVGGCWDDVHNEQSAKLRQRAITVSCVDTHVALRSCCGMAALYGVASLGLSLATGLSCSADMAGEAILADELAPKNNQADLSLLQVPPLTVLIDHELVEKSVVTRDGEKRREAHVEQDLFGVAVSTKREITLFPLEIRVSLPSPSGIPVRNTCQLRAFVESADSPEVPDEPDMLPETKRRKLDNGGSQDDVILDDFMVEVQRFAKIAASALQTNISSS